MTARRWRIAGASLLLASAFIVNRSAMVEGDTPRRQEVRLPARPIFVVPQAGGAQDDAQARARLAAEAKARQVFVRDAARLIAHGKRAEAETQARSRGTGDPAAAAVLGRLAADRGKNDEALALLQPAASADSTGEAALELGLLLQRLGRSEDAGPILGRIAYVRRPADASEAFRAARAARALGQTRSASSLFGDALAMSAGDPGINTAWGDLFFEKFNPAEAVRSFRAALAADGDWAPAHLGLARALADEDASAAAAAARRALELDPALFEAHIALAHAALDADRAIEARAEIDRALEINPRSLEGHALLAAMAYVDGRTAEFDAEMTAIFAMNPTDGDAYRVVAAQAANRYRFEDAVGLLRKALALEPDNTRAGG